MSEPHDEPVVRDKRRVHFDPVTGAVSDRSLVGGEGSASAGSSAGPTGRVGAGAGYDLGTGGPGSVQLSQLRTEVAERTADLQRVQAEYANYRKRVERDREAVREFAVAEALSALLPVLDDIGRAREHDELEGGFRQVAEAFEAAVAKVGLTRFGQAGDPFDPTQHEALMHAYSDEVTEPTAVQILQPGYSYAGRVIRPARVAVAEPTAALPGQDDDTPATLTDTDADDAGSPPSGDQ